MNANTKIKKDLGRVATALDENISDKEMDELLEGQHEEVEALLEEARLAVSRGDTVALEPLHAFLRRARERHKSSR